MSRTVLPTIAPRPDTWHDRRLSTLSTMNCCEHTDGEHRNLTVCEDQIHYPSEDYPCLCEAFETTADGAKCIECSHATSKHVSARVCVPESGAHCACRVVL